MRLKVIDNSILNETSKKAKLSERLRMNHNFHELSDNLQRMLNAIEPESYIQPHRHLDPPKVELFLILRGRAAVILFDQDGSVLDSKVLTPTGDCHGVEITPGQFHSIISLESDTVVFEAKDGPYIATTDKDFASFAPSPEEKEAAARYTKRLTEELKLS
ncbi:MAG: WbuC family cupin fold metalloprotein [Proteobacteria bacterium]|nr:WbuC family cupin fold metalloprotein [Pseudomonadota bacterium]